MSWSLMWPYQPKWVCSSASQRRGTTLCGTSTSRALSSWSKSVYHTSDKQVQEPTFASFRQWLGKPLILLLVFTVVPRPLSITWWSGWLKSWWPIKSGSQDWLLALSQPSSQLLYGKVTPPYALNPLDSPRTLETLWLQFAQKMDASWTVKFTRSMEGSQSFEWNKKLSKLCP